MGMHTELSCACAWRMYMLVAPVTRCSATLSVHGCARDDPREQLPPRARSGTYSSWYSACSTDERSSPIIKPALHVRRRLETGQREASFCELWIVPFNSHFHKAALRLPKHVVGRRPSSKWAASARPSHRSDAWRAHTRTSTAVRQSHSEASAPLPERCVDSLSSERRDAEEAAADERSAPKTISHSPRRAARAGSCSSSSSCAAACREARRMSFEICSN
eukprot:6790693-Prymnesium_polylepis.1